MSGKRVTCDRCMRPKVTCICDLYIPTVLATKIVVLQHPSEVGHAKGTVPLLSGCFPNSRVFTGECFDPKVVVPAGLATAALLYPQTDPLFAEVEQQVVSTLVVLDGTWKKSKKILYLNPWLLQLRVVSIRDRESQYHIRKAKSAHQLSTFEATVYALCELEEQRGGSLDLTSFGEVFGQFVARLSDFTPPR